MVADGQRPYLSAIDFHIHPPWATSDHQPGVRLLGHDRGQGGDQYIQSLFGFDLTEEQDGISFTFTCPLSIPTVVSEIEIGPMRNDVNFVTIELVSLDQGRLVLGMVNDDLSHISINMSDEDIGTPRYGSPRLDVVNR